MEFDTERFIMEIHNQPTLWNTKCSNYSDRNVKQREWEEVVNIYGAELSSEEKKKLGMKLQKKWRNIRDCFVKTHKAKETKRGSAAKKKYPYIFYNSLLFLKDTVSVNSTTSNITFNAEGHNEDQIEEAQHIAVHSSNSSLAPKRNKKNKNDNVGRELIGSLSKNVETKNVEHDEDRFFFLSVVKEFKKIPEHLRMKTKLNILNVIQNAQISNYSNTWDWTTYNNPYRGHNSAKKKYNPYSPPMLIPISVTTPYKETVVNNPTQVQSFSSTDSKTTHKSKKMKLII